MLDYGYCHLDYRDRLYRDALDKWVDEKRFALYIHFERLGVTDAEIDETMMNWAVEEGDYQEKMWLWNLTKEDMILLDGDRSAHEDLFDCHIKDSYDYDE